MSLTQYGPVTSGVRILAALALLGASGPQWLAVASLPDGGSVEINAGATGTIGGLVRGWWRLRPASPRADGTAIESRAIAIDCAGLTLATTETIAIGADGQMLRHDRESDATALARLARPRPGAYEETAARALCRLRRD